MVVTVAAVCPYWRAIVLDTVTLWSSFTLTNQKPIVKARLWNTRSSGIIKSLHIQTANSTTILALDCLTLTSLQSSTLDRIFSSDMLTRPSLVPSFAENLTSVEAHRVETGGNLEAL